MRLALAPSAFNCVYKKELPRPGAGSGVRVPLGGQQPDKETPTPRETEPPPAPPGARPPSSAPYWPVPAGRRRNQGKGGLGGAQPQQLKTRYGRMGLESSGNTLTTNTL